MNKQGQRISERSLSMFWICLCGGLSEANILFGNWWIRRKRQRLNPPYPNFRYVN